MWAGDDRTLLFKQYLGEGGATAQIRLLDTAAPGGSLAAASTRVPFPSRLISGRVEDPVQAYGNMLLLPDGHKIVAAVSHLQLAWPSWASRRSGCFASIVRGLLPAAVPGNRPSHRQEDPLLQPTA